MTIQDLDTDDEYFSAVAHQTFEQNLDQAIALHERRASAQMLHKVRQFLLQHPQITSDELPESLPTEQRLLTEQVLFWLADIAEERLANSD